MKPGLACLLLLPACSHFVPDGERAPSDYSLTWYCISPEGCERTEEVTRIDQASITDYYFLHLANSQDDSFVADAQIIVTDSPGDHCARVHFLTLFGHELEPSKFCYNPGGFEIDLSIPNSDPATHSKWVVSGRDTSLL